MCQKYRENMSAACYHSFRTTLKNIVFLSCRTWDIQDIKNNVYAIYLFIVGGKYY